MALFQVIAQHTYSAEDQGQISFKAGDIIDVLEEDDSGWWVGTLNGERGYFPATYVEKYEKPKGTLAKKPPPLPSKKSQNGTQDTKETEIKISKKLASNEQVQQADPNAEIYYSVEVLNLKFNPNAKTRFGIAANYMALSAVIASFFLGMSAFAWGDSNASPALRVKQKLATGCGVYCFFLAPAMYAFQYKFGERRTKGGLPLRGMLYLVVGILPYFTIVTALAGGMWTITAIFDILAWSKKEEYEPEAKKQPSEGWKEKLEKYTTCSYYVTWLKEWWEELRKQSKVRKYAFLGAYLLFNLIYVSERCAYYRTVVSSGNAAGSDYSTKLNSKDTSVSGSLTASQKALAELYDKNGGRLYGSWFPVAKMFGNLCDINCAFIVLPVCRSFIASLYNISTDQRATSRAARFCLSFVPLDKAIQFHKVCAFLSAFGGIVHTWAHYNHYAQVPATYDAVYGATVWASGVIIIIAMQILYSTSFEAVRRGKFELFWYTHHLFVIFFVTLLFHGHKSWNPNYWKWFLVPGSLYLLERVTREVKASKPVGLISVTHMNNKSAKVFCLELEKTGPIRSHQEGQYVFLNCPIITKFQWHPFTISSPPEQKTLTLHIRNMGEGTWTGRLQTFLQAMSPKKAYDEFFHWDGVNKVPKTTGPDGRNLLCIDGPMAAPTQHLGEYGTAMIVGAGIGVTPVRATLQSIVYYRFKRGIGHSFPDHAYCVWIVNWEQLAAYRFMVRTLKEAEDELYDMRKKNPEQMKSKILQMHIFVTSVPKNPTFDASELDSGGDKQTDLAIWGPHYDDTLHDEARTVSRETAPFTEIDIYRTLRCPESEPVSIGDIIVHNGRPKWPDLFGPIQQHHSGETIGVMFCGPDVVAHELKKQCGNFTDFSTNTTFILHKENF